LRTLPNTRKPRSSNILALAQPMSVDAPVMTTDLMTPSPREKLNEVGREGMLKHRPDGLPPRVPPTLTASCSVRCYSIFHGNDLERIAAGPRYRQRRQRSDPVRHRRFIA